MGRKKLIKGPNAERVEQRIAQVPKDITETSIFKVLKEIEEKSKTQNEEALNETVIEEKIIDEKAEDTPPTKAQKKTRKKTKTKKLSPLQEALIGENSIAYEDTVKTTEEETTEKKKTKKKKTEKKISFTKAEKEIIVKSCINYKNSLPIYLKSVQREVKLIDNVIKKLK